MDSKPLILIDLDHTLLDTTKIRSELPLVESAVSAFSQFTGLETDKYLYQDALAFINYASTYFTPSIFTEGPVGFQNSKINHSSIANLIGPNLRFVYESETKSVQLSTLIGLYHPKILVDDHPVHLDNAAKLGLVTIRIKRGRHETEPDITPPNLTVFSLQEIITKDLLKQFSN